MTEQFEPGKQHLQEQTQFDYFRAWEEQLKYPLQFPTEGYRPDFNVGAR